MKTKKTAISSGKRPEYNLCGPVVKLRDWRRVKPENLTLGEKVCLFAERYCRVPEGKLVGQPIRLDEFQQRFIIAIYDNPHITRRAILSIARKNGKTALIAILLLAHLVGPCRHMNSQLISGAMSRDQASLVHNLASKMIELNPTLAIKLRAVPSTKKIISATTGSEFKALAADGKTAHGLSPKLAILDEVGQIIGPSSPFVEAITTSQGAHIDPLLIVISTQAPSDADMLSQWIDDAARSGDPHTVCHVYAADKDCDLMDKKQWAKANPGLGSFRSIKDLEEQLKQASRLPSQEAMVRNLLLNQRISLQNLWVAPSTWKENNKPIDLDLFNRVPVHIGLDLSMRNDLTAAVLSAADEYGDVHLMPFVFIPEDGLEEKARRDRAPYQQWITSGHLIAVPGKTIDYSWVSQFLYLKTQDMMVASVQFDRWNIENFRKAATAEGFEPVDWIPVGQGYRDFSPRLTAFETALLQNRVRHGNHPLLNMAVSNAISVSDPAGNKKLDKSATSQRIDPLVAAVMAAFPCLDGKTTAVDIGALIG
jgi:phage terminase large subunit-like protein